jgi:hypothetical protein
MELCNIDLAGRGLVSSIDSDLRRAPKREYSYFPQKGTGFTRLGYKKRELDVPQVLLSHKSSQMSDDEMLGAKYCEEFGDGNCLKARWAI